MKTNEMYTNVAIFYQIAKESYNLMIETDNKFRRPLEDDPSRVIITQDLSRTSFKSGMKVIVFSCMTLEALLHIKLGFQLSKTQLDKIDKKSYLEKLSLLNYCNEKIEANCERLRNIRRELIHEKAHKQTSLSIVQQDAKFAMSFLDEICNHLKVKLG